MATSRTRKRYRYSVQRDPEPARRATDQAGAVEAISTADAIERVVSSEGAGEFGRGSSFNYWETGGWWIGTSLTSGETITIVVVVD